MSDLESDFFSHLSVQSAAELCFEISEMLRKLEHKADHYQILGISRRATFEDIKKAYRELSKKFHPDRNAQLAEFNYQVKSDLERIFARIQEAFIILNDEAKRRKYDGTLRFPVSASTPVLEITESSVSSSLQNTSLSTIDTPDPEGGISIFDGKAAAQLCFEMRELLHKIEQDADHYQVFEISRRASPKEIDQAYSKLSRKYHPDRYIQLAKFHFQVKNELETVFTRIQEAYDVLSDETKRRKYDALLWFPSTSGSLTKPVTGSFPQPPPIQAPLASQSESSTPTSGPLQPPPSWPSASSQPSDSSRSVNQTKPMPSIPTNQFKPLETNQPVAQLSKLTASEHYMRSLQCLGENDLQAAHQHISRAVELKPRDVDYRTQLARVLAGMPNVKKQAEEHYLLAINLETDVENLPDLYREVAHFYRKNGMTRYADEMEQKATNVQDTKQKESTHPSKKPSQTGSKTASGLNRISGPLQKLIEKFKK